jgi:hypothetical protein
MCGRYLERREEWRKEGNKDKYMEKGRENYKGINYSGSKQRLGDGGSILGRGVVTFFSPAPRWAAGNFF